MDIAIGYDMNMVMSMEPMTTGPLKPADPEALRHAPERPKDEAQQEAAFDLIMSELLKTIISLPQQGSLMDQSSEATGQAQAASRQLQENLLVPSMNAVPVPSAGETEQALLQGALPQPAENQNKTEPSLHDGVPVLDHAQDGKGNPALTEAFLALPQAEEADKKGEDSTALETMKEQVKARRAPDPEPLQAHSDKDRSNTNLKETPSLTVALQTSQRAEDADNNVEDSSAPEAMKEQVKAQRAPDPEPLQAHTDKDKSGISRKESSSLPEPQKTAEPFAVAGGGDKGSLQETGEMKPLPDNGQSPDPALAAYAGRIDHLHSAAEPAGAMPAHRVQAPSGAMHVEGHKFVITRHDGTSIEVSLQPEGLGKLDIELVFDKGLVNAHIQASHEAGKELVEQNMTEILNILAQEGITIGGFSVSLKQGRDAEPEGMKRGFQRRNDEDAARGEEAIIRKNSRQGVISIFV